MSAASTMKPLVEHLDPMLFEVKQDTKGCMVVSGRFQICEVVNGNKRRYPRRLWEKVVNDPEVQKAIASRMVKGEVEHPADGQTNLARVSHLITKLYMKGDEVIGEAEILDTPSGLILQEFFRKRIPTGISSRGRGSSSFQDGVEIVEADTYKFDTFDFVCSPSAPGAYPGLAESLKQCIQGPYRTESSMSDKNAEILKLQVNAHEVLERLQGADLATLDKAATELVASEAKVQTLLSQQPELKEAAAGALELIKRASAAVYEARLKKYSETSKDFDTRVNLASNTGTYVYTSGTSLTTSGNVPLNPTNEAQRDGLVALLKEAAQREQFWREQAQKNAATTGSVSKPVHEATEKLGRSLLSENRRLTKALEAMSKKFESVQAARLREARILEQAVAQNDRAKILRRVAEAIRVLPALKKVESLLVEAESVEDLERSIKTLSQALSPEGVPTPATASSTSIIPPAAAPSLICAKCGVKSESAKRMSMCPKCKQGRFISEAVAAKLAAANLELDSKKNESVVAREPSPKVESALPPKEGLKPSEVAEELEGINASTAAALPSRSTPLMESVRNVLARRGMR